jgi:hypothetical protein
MYAAKRRALDRALLASMEREIANEEKLRASPDWAKLQRPITAVEMLEHPEAKAEVMYGDVNRIKRPDETERARIARAFGRPLP